MSLVNVQQAAVGRFAQRGFAAVGIRELGREVGLTSATLYHYAPSKEHLLAGVMRACLDELLASGERAVRASADPSEQLARLVSVHVAMSATNPLTCRVTDQEVRSLTGTNLADVLALRDRYEKVWHGVLSRGAKQGAFRVADVRLARLGLLDMCNGIANWYDPAGRTSLPALQRHYTELACRAVDTEPPAELPDVTVPRLDSEPIGPVAAARRHRGHSGHRMSIIDARVRLPQDQRPDSAYTAPARQTEQYDRVLNLTDKMNAGRLVDLLADLDANDIGHAVMHAETEGGESADALNDALGRVLAEHPGRFTGVGTVDLTPPRPTRAARQVAAAHANGLRGISVQPAFLGLDIDARELYPTYARAEELGLVVAIHTGITYSRMHPLRHERAELFDQVACDFPDLRLIAAHSGWPWAADYAAVARRHPTVHLEFGGLAPKYVARPGSGWDPLFAMMPNVLRDQVLYGSDWPVMPPARVLAEWRASGLPAATLDALFHDNAARLFGLTS